MSNDKTQDIELTAAEAAKLVKRPVPELDKAGKPTGASIEKDVAAREVLAHSLRGSVVTVVTIDGQKLTATLSAANLAALAKAGAKA